MIKHIRHLFILPRLVLIITLVAVGSVLISAHTAAHGQNVKETSVQGNSTNLIQNPSNEAPLVGGEITGWQEIIGSNWKQRSTDPLPFEGEAYFFAGVGASAELQQDVDVSTYAVAIDAGTQSFDFTGYVRSWSDGQDTSRIVLEYLNGAKDNVLSSFDSGEIANASAWQEVTDSRLAPVGTRYIRVRLISKRGSGSNNDGYFDALALTTPEYVIYLPFVLK